MGLVISAHTPEYLCPNLGYFSPLFSNRGYLEWVDTLYSHAWHCSSSSLRKSKATFCLLTQRPVDELSHSSNFPRFPTSPSLALWEHKQTLFLLLWEVGTQHAPPPVPPILSLRSIGPLGSKSSAVVSQAWMSQDVEGACLRALAGNRTWEEWIVKALMSGSPTSVPLGRATHKHTPVPLCQIADKGSEGPELHSKGQ